MAVIVNGDGILTGISSLATALTDLTSGRGTVTGVATVGTLQLGAGVSMGSPRSQNAAIFTNGIACPDDEDPLKIPGCVTDLSKLYDTVAFPPPGLVFTPVITNGS